MTSRPPKRAAVDRPPGPVAQPSPPAAPITGGLGNTEDREYPHPAEVSLPGPLRTSAVPGETSPPLRRSVPRGVATGPKAPAGTGTSADSAVPAGLQAMAAAMKEDRGPDSLDAHVRRYLKDLGLLGYHTHDSRRSHGGFPDWTITGKRTIFRELKTQRGKVSAAQQEWLDALTEAGDDATVWRPMDLLAGRVARELAAISRLGRAA